MISDVNLEDNWRQLGLETVISMAECAPHSDIYFVLGDIWYVLGDIGIFLVISCVF